MGFISPSSPAGYNSPTLPPNPPCSTTTVFQQAAPAFTLQRFLATQEQTTPPYTPPYLIRPIPLSQFPIRNPFRQVVLVTPDRGTSDGETNQDVANNNNNVNNRRITSDIYELYTQSKKAENGRPSGCFVTSANDDVTKSQLTPTCTVHMMQDRVLPTAFGTPLNTPSRTSLEQSIMTSFQPMTSSAETLSERASARQRSEAVVPYSIQASLNSIFWRSKKRIH